MPIVNIAQITHIVHCTLSKMVNFRVQSGKFTPGRKIYTDGVSRVTDNYQVWVQIFGTLQAKKPK